MICDRPLSIEDAFGVCRLSVDVRGFVNVNGMRYIKANQGGLQEGNTWRLMAYVVGVNTPSIEAFERVRRATAKEHPELEDTALAGSTVQLGGHHYMLCLPCKMLDDGDLTIQGWSFASTPEGLEHVH